MSEQKRYYVKTQRYDNGWKRPDNHPAWFYSIDDADEFLDEFAPPDEKTESRIVAEDGEIVYWGVEPYGGGYIDRTQSGAIWLEDLRESYGFEEDEWREALQQWLQKDNS